MHVCFSLDLHVSSDAEVFSKPLRGWNDDSLRHDIKGSNPKWSHLWIWFLNQDLVLIRSPYITKNPGRSNCPGGTSTKCFNTIMKGGPKHSLGRISPLWKNICPWRLYPRESQADHIFKACWYPSLVSCCPGYRDVYNGLTSFQRIRGSQETYGNELSYKII